VIWLSLLVSANVPSSRIVYTPKLEARRPTESSVLTRLTQRYNPESGSLHSHHRLPVTVSHGRYCLYWPLSTSYDMSLLCRNRRQLPRPTCRRSDHNSDSVHKEDYCDVSGCHSSSSQGRGGPLEFCLRELPCPQRSFRDLLMLIA
jgi:hypothetical protein